MYPYFTEFSFQIDERSHQTNSPSNISENDTAILMELEELLNDLEKINIFREYKYTSDLYDVEKLFVLLEPLEVNMFIEIIYFFMLMNCSFLLLRMTYLISSVA